MYPTFDHGQHNQTDTTTEVSPDLGELAENIDDVSVEMTHYTVIEAVGSFKLHPTSKSYIYKELEHLKQLWMGIWQHTHTITTTNISPDLR